MSMADLVTEVAGETVHLLPERALFVPRTNTLYAADLHWGKEQTFSARGIPLPTSITTSDLIRLDLILQRTQAQRLVILGDLLHARESLHPQVIAAVLAWRQAHQHLQIQVVRGNHDRRAGRFPDEWHIEVIEQPADDLPFALLHEPQAIPNRYALAGHLHPAVMLKGRAKQRLALPCFWFGTQIGVLPAFGGFTGNATITPQPADRVFVVMQAQVLRVQ
ncbi:MAG: ligase-associated DNA damage response endonuclease PdeM [Anaerolineae bacterium]|nr:ligase-associated DNA damage response endonuclease PdeM [Anaerolineae bacterium]